jgi:hypothetical protein
MFSGKVRYAREDVPGLDAARNRALRDATSELVAFIDDDAVADSRWLAALRRNFFHPLVACATGLTMPLELETPAQEWFERHTPFQKGFKRRVFKGEDHNPLAVGRIGAGVNMCLRRSVAEEVGWFDEALDSGTPTRSGGDHEMFTRLLSHGYHIVYDPTALNFHRHRRTWEDLRKTLYGYGVGAYSNLTRSLLVERELTAPRIAWSWFCHEQFPTLVRSLLRRPNSRPLDLILSELRGCLEGPFAYFASRRRYPLKPRPA